MRGNRSMLTAAWPCGVLCAALLLSCAACNSAAQVDCDDDDPPEAPTAPETALIRSQVKLETRTKYGASGAAEPASNLVSAVFVDVTRVERVMRSVNDQKFSMTCAGLTGAPVDQCRPPHTENCVRVQLAVDDVKITGLPAAVTLEKKGTGTYVDTEAPAPLFGQEDIGVAVSVSKTGDPAYFRPYTQTLPPPPTLEVAAPKPGQAVGARDLEVRWNGGGGDLIEIAIQIERADPGATPDTDKVVCLVKDDGCHAVPASAFDWLRLGQLAPEDLFKVSITREKTVISTLDATTAAELKATHNVELLLPQEK